MTTDQDIKANGSVARVFLINPAIERVEDEDEGAYTVAEVDLTGHMLDVGQVRGPSRAIQIGTGEDGPFALTLTPEQAGLLAMDLVALLACDLHRDGRTLTRHP
jgi:hypothetical protein